MVAFLATASTFDLTWSRPWFGRPGVAKTIDYAQNRTKVAGDFLMPEDFITLPYNIQQLL
jgi:hypothetical protein